MLHGHGNRVRQIKNAFSRRSKNSEDAAAEEEAPRSSRRHTSARPYKHSKSSHRKKSEDGSVSSSRRGSESSSRWHGIGRRHPQQHSAFDTEEEERGGGFLRKHGRSKGGGATHRQSLGSRPPPGSQDCFTPEPIPTTSRNTLGGAGATPVSGRRRDSRYDPPSARREQPRSMITPPASSAAELRYPGADRYPPAERYHPQPVSTPPPEPSGGGDSISARKYVDHHQAALALPAKDPNRRNRSGDTSTPNTETTRATTSSEDPSPPVTLPPLRSMDSGVLTTPQGHPVDLTKFFAPLPWEPRRWRLLKTISPAIHGEVRYVYDEQTRKSAVVKILRNQAVRPRQEGELENPLVEIGAMSYLFGPQAVFSVDMVAQLKGVYRDTKFTYLVTEHCSDGELFREVVNRKSLNETHVKAIALQLCFALYSLHRNGICHRDVSLENTLSMADRTVRLIDFGQAEVIYEPDGSRKWLTGSAGKQYYRAPEMLRGKYLGPPVDVFALGVQIFIMAIGSPPWNKASKNDQRYRNLTSRPTGIDTALKKWGKRDTVSSAFVDLLVSIFCAEPEQRPTIEELLLHPWFSFDAKVWQWVNKRGCSKTIRLHATNVSKYLQEHPEGRHFGTPPTDAPRHFATPPQSSTNW